MGFFVIFSSLVSLVFLEITYNDTVQQCLQLGKTLGKTHKKIRRPKLGPNGPKSGPKLLFLSFFQVWFISFP